MIYLNQSPLSKFLICSANYTDCTKLYYLRTYGVKSPVSKGLIRYIHKSRTYFVGDQTNNAANKSAKEVCTH
jgi:hypothetical protein